jgi:ParB-like chromosome segregation protein Spo0J
MEVRLVRVDQLDPNAYRNIGTYPVIRPKVDALKNSIAVVGMWPSIIVRQKGKRYEQAFGMSRLTAAKELGLKEVPVIIDNSLTDEQMVQYMGRENGEDYGSDVQIALNTWEAAATYLDRSIGKRWKPLQAAELLGWTERDGQLNLLARTCSKAFKLIDANEMRRDDLAGIPVSAAFNVVERVISRMELIERNKTLKPQEKVTMKRRVVDAGKKTAAGVRDGSVAARDVRSKVDVNFIDSAETPEQRVVDFRTFGKVLTDSIYRTLRTDAIAEKLQATIEVVPLLVDDDDKSMVRQIGFDLDELEKRSKGWRRKIEHAANHPTKVVNLKAIGGN